MGINKKINDLKEILAEMESVLILFSGGVDSSFLSRMAFEILGDRAVAVTATSPTYPVVEFEWAKRIASDIGIRQIIIESNELEIPLFSDNDHRRCYYCKKELFTLAREKADELGIKEVAEGSNLNDLGDYRPGREAAEELKVRSPLLDARLTKKDIRTLSSSLGLETWDKPASACLSSRFPYGTKITRHRLKMVEEAEDFLHKNGFRSCRVRYHGEIARIELNREDMLKVFDAGIKEAVVEKLKEIGFSYVTLDLEGYRTGSLNEPLGLISEYVI
ncbi:MAG: ATP-dependent sacrificial sulfur transferase LarE [Thermodesulfobacteriota bacterium]